MGFTVDGIHYIIDEPRPFSMSHGSHKHGYAALLYEFGLYTHKEKVAWIHGPYPAGTGDREVFKKKLQAAIKTKQTNKANRFHAIVDNGYFAIELLDVCSF